MLDSKQLAELRSEPVVPEIGNRVKRAIDLAGDTQANVARQLGMTTPHVSDICRGVTPMPTIDTAHKFADFFGCSIEDLFPRREQVA